MGKYVLYIQSNYAHSEPTHLTPLIMVDYFSFKEAYNSAITSQPTWDLDFNNLSVELPCPNCCLKQQSLNQDFY